jgi:O-antigen/teichoic acid export membrane protein
MIKNIVKKFLTYGVGNVLQTSLNFILLPLYLRIFSPKEYGVISVLIVVMTLLTLFSSGGIMNGMIRLYYETGDVKRKELVGTTWLWYFVAASIGGIILFSQAHLFSRLLFDTESHTQSVRLLSLVFFFAMLRTVPFYIFRLQNKAELYVGFSLFNFLIDFGLKLYFIVYLSAGISGYFESGAISSFLTLLAMLPFIVQDIRFSFNMEYFQPLFKLGFPYIFTGLAVWTLDVSDRVLLSRLSGETAVGVYALAYNFANIFGIVLATPVALLMDPFFFAYAAEKSTADTKQLLQRTLIYFFLVGGLVYLGISLGSGELLRAFTTHFGAKAEYLEAIKLIPVLTLAPFLYFLSTQSSLAGLLAKKPEVNSWAYSIAAIVNFALNLVMIPKFGALGAALTTLIAYLVLDILSYSWMGKIFPVQYDWKGVVVALFYLLIALVTGWYIRLDQPLISLSVKVITGSVVFTLLTLFTDSILTRAERKKILAYFVEGRKKLNQAKSLL